MNMFKAVPAKTTKEYMANLSDDRRYILEELDKIIIKTAPSLKKKFAYNMPGYGEFNYKNNRKEQLTWPVISVASQKNYVSIYVCALEGGEYVAEKYKDSLGKVSVGKSCIRFKKLDDLNLDTLRKIIVLAEKYPGLVYAKDKK
jgi:uncharacterized protein YdhG (YjbR/CyaY superfamily)